MVIVQGWVRFESAAEIDRLQAVSIEMMQTTRAEEPGCITYAYARDLADPALLHVIEQWRDDAAINAHFATPHMAAFGQAIAGAKIVSMLVKAYAGEETRVLMQR